MKTLFNIEQKMKELENSINKLTIITNEHEIKYNKQSKQIEIQNVKLYKQNEQLNERLIETNEQLFINKVNKQNIKITELENKGISSKAIVAIQPLFDLQGTNKEKLDKIAAFLSESKIGLKGVEELRSIFSLLDKIEFNQEKIEFDITLARGLNYYTGAIFEVLAHDVKMGSICGGGRYDDLTGLFGLKDLSGVGISFGADRIYDILKELDLFPKYLTEGLTVLFMNFGEKESEIALKLAVSLRANSIDCEVYPSPSKMQKQLKYANDRGVKFVAIIGEEEMEVGKIILTSI